MPEISFQSLRMFISSPGDVPTERHALHEVIDKINGTIRSVLGLEVTPVTWEMLPPITPQLPDERIQDILNEEISKCHIFVLILWKRYGSMEPGHKKSNTQREVELALDLLKRERKLMFLSYFRELPSNADIGPQENMVRKLRRNLEQSGVWYRTYSKPKDFKELLTHDLYRTAIRYRHATKKHKCLSAFWQFGFPDRQTHPLLAVIYPSMDRSFMGPSPLVPIWFNRLVPNIVFEDHKALQKIEKTLRLFNFREFRIYNTANIPSDIRFMNAVWICLPRNHSGLQALSDYKSISKFKMLPKREYQRVPLYWRQSLKSDKWIAVHSPLSKYLKEQRSNMNVDGEWIQDMGNIVAKDYSILARFNRVSSIPMIDGRLKDFFVAGLRGLGTWGAAWFLDRRYEDFVGYKPNDVIQLLLEVEYRDGRIYHVRDVSKKPQKYFNEENNLSSVRRNICAYNQR